MIGAFLYRTGALLARWLPPRIAVPLTDIISWTQYHLRAGSRRAVFCNLRIVMGSHASEKAIRDAAWSVFSNFGKSIYCFLRLPFMSPEQLKALCDYAGLDTVARELTKKGGFIIAGPHVGPWEIAGACLAAVGVRLHTVALEHPSAGVTRFFQERRRCAGIVSYPIGGSLSRLSHALEEGGSVALLIDRTYGRVRRSFSVFGRSMELPTGHAALAVRCRVPIVTGMCVFAPAGRFKFVFKGPYYPDASLGEAAAIEDLHRRCRADMEEFIREYADQWFHFTPIEGENECPKIPRG